MDKLVFPNLKSRAPDINVGHNEVPIAGQICVPAHTPLLINSLGARSPISEVQNLNFFMEGISYLTDCYYQFKLKLIMKILELDVFSIMSESLVVTSL